MAEETKLPTIRELLTRELAAIKQRVENAAEDAEKQFLARQYGQRIEHLVERLKTPDDPPPAG